MMYVGCCGLPIFSFPGQDFESRPISLLYRLIKANASWLGMPDGGIALFLGLLSTARGCRIEVQNLLFRYAGLKTTAAAGLIRIARAHHDQLIGTR